MIRLLFLSLCFTFVHCARSDGPSESQTKFGTVAFPSAPVGEVTPGSVCDDPDEYRYPERIMYCSRRVSSNVKRSIIQFYDETYGFKIQNMPRSDFKVDHFISLCMGGSNSRDNLWPQHHSIYRITDPIEEKLCRLMAQGRIMQADAIEKIRMAKINLDSAPGIDDWLDGELNQ